MSLVRILFLSGALAALAPPAAADDFERRIPAGPGGRLRLELDSGNVVVEAHDEREVRLDANAQGSWPSSFDLEVEGNGKDVEIHGKFGGLAGIFGGRVRVRVRIPERYSVEIRSGGGSVELEEVGGRVEVETGGGSIELDGADGPAVLRTSGGAVRVYDVRGALVVRTSGGPIRVSDVAGPVEARTSGGSIQMDDVGGPVQLETSGGSVSVRFRESPEGTVRTSGGSIEAELPAGSGLRIDARTSGGRVEFDSDLPLRGRFEPGRIEGDLYGGGPALELRTSGGNIRIGER